MGREFQHRRAAVKHAISYLAPEEQPFVCAFPEVWQWFGSYDSDMKRHIESQKHRDAEQKTGDLLLDIYSVPKSLEG